MKKIQITLHGDGTQKVEVVGGVGDSCLVDTRALENRLGVADGERVLKPEYHEAAVETVAEQERERGR